jgi:hypothetical protein
MKSKRSPGDILGIVLGAVSIALVVAALVYLLGSIGARPFQRLRGHWWPRTQHSWSGSWQSEEGTETVSQPVQRLEVTNISGEVQVEGWAQDTVEVHYVKQARGSEALRDFRIEIRTDGDTLHVRPVYVQPAGLRFGPVSFDIKVPATLKEIKVKSVSGRIVVANLPADISQELETVSGAIQSERSADLQAKTTSGAIDFSFAGGDLRVKTVSGRIDGKIRGLERGGSVELETVSGSVDVAAFRGLDAQLRLQSVSGSISCGFPVQISEQKRNRLEGRIGAGSVPFSAKTVSGSITLSPLE